jgi:hypothetical protein
MSSFQTEDWATPPRDTNPEPRTDTSEFDISVGTGDELDRALEVEEAPPTLDTATVESVARSFQKGAKLGLQALQQVRGRYSVMRRCRRCHRHLACAPCSPRTHSSPTPASVTGLPVCSCVCSSVHKAWWVGWPCARHCRSTQPSSRRAPSPRCATRGEQSHSSRRRSPAPFS